MLKLLLLHSALFVKIPLIIDSQRISMLMFFLSRVLQILFTLVEGLVFP